MGLVFRLELSVVEGRDAYVQLPNSRINAATVSMTIQLRARLSNDVRRCFSSGLDRGEGDASGRSVYWKPVPAIMVVVKGRGCAGRVRGLCGTRC